MQHAKKKKLRQLRKWRIRKKVVGTTARPRMSVTFSNEHIYVQFIDDSKGVTLASASTRGKNPSPIGTSWPPMSRVRRKLAPWPPTPPRAKGSLRLYSIGMAPVTTARLKPWRTPRVKRD